MPRDVTELRVFIASPGDVTEERESVVRAVEALNRTLGHTDPVVVRPVMWERDTFSSAGERAQAVINAQIAPYDIFLGILWQRLGTPTGVAESGTAEEFQLAHASWKDTGRPALMFYVRKSPVELNADALSQWEKVLRFQEQLRSSGLLIHEYKEVEEFERLVQEHLHRQVADLLGIVNARRARDDSPPQESDAPGEDEDGETEADLLALRLKLEMKMAWLCKHLLAGPNQPTYATIGSLAYDGYLTSDQARLASRIMTARPGSQRPEIVEQFVKEAEETVSTFRAAVFDPFVRKALEADGWEILDFPQAPGHRPDFLAVKDDRTFRISPRLITAGESAIRRRTVERLSAPNDEPQPVEGRIIVIPDASSAVGDGPEASPRVVKVADLLPALEGR